MGKIKLLFLAFILFYFVNYVTAQSYSTYYYDSVDLRRGGYGPDWYRSNPTFYDWDYYYNNPGELIMNPWVMFAMLFLLFFAAIYSSLSKFFINQKSVSSVISGIIALFISAYIVSSVSIEIIKIILIILVILVLIVILIPFFKAIKASFAK